MKYIFSFFIWVYWTICIVTFFIMVCLVRLVTFPFDRYYKIPNKMIRWITSMMLMINPGWKLDIRGADPEKVAPPTIVVANHQSFLDLLLLNQLPWRMKWVVWKQLYYIPFFGWLMSLTGQVGIRQKSVHSLHKLEQLAEPIEAGIPAMIFPEGERTLSGEVQRFRGGAFKLASEYNFNILPVVLKGAYEALPRGRGAIAMKKDFVISVLEPVSAQEFESADEMRDTVHWLIEKEYRELQEEDDDNNVQIV